MKQFKKCGKCQVVMSSDKFYKCASRSDGLRGQCIECIVVTSAKSRIKTGRTKTTKINLD